MTGVSVIHREFRFDTPPVNGAYRCVGLLPDGQIGVFVHAEGSDQGTLEFAFPLNEAQFFAERILAGDMGAARKPGMSRMLAASFMVLAKAGFAGGVLAEAPADPGSGPGQAPGSGPGQAPGSGPGQAPGGEGPSCPA